MTKLLTFDNNHNQTRTDQEWGRTNGLQ